DVAAALAEFQAAFTGQLIAGTDAGREQDDVGFQVGLISEAHPVQALLAVNDSGGVLGYVDRGATCLDLALEQPGTGNVDLNGHQPWGKLDHVGLQAELGKGVGRLQSKQAAADNRAYRRRLRRGYNRFQVLDGAIDEARSEERRVGEGGTSRERAG